MGKAGRHCFRSALAAMFLLALAGCGGGDKASARDEMQVSRAAYQFCLAQHPTAPQTCDSAKTSYDAGMKAFRDNSVSGLSGRSE